MVSHAEIFRSVRLRECNERAFMLYAVGIASAIARDGVDFVLLVDENDAPSAANHLQLYERESLYRPPPPPPPPKLHPHAVRGSVGYALVVIGVAFAISEGLWRLDAFDVGELNAALVQQGQWWRVWTALTLHLDGLHLLANTVFGVWFGYLASRLMGVGNAWLFVVLGAGFANWVEGYFGPPGHLSVGASTAVFTALGLLSGFSWRTRLAYPQRWALRWAPLVAGIVLLSWTGTGGESLDQTGTTVGSGQTVDVLAHALGFAVGLGGGAIAALKAATRMLDRVPQWLAGLLALLPLVLAWARALSS
ncbi:MAG: rhomboid family intramembrane serine protease [Proteobacteria bacterium]|nr:rhomboid family intramembrane serine protease [Pseudomonadota bacterium]